MKSLQWSRFAVSIIPQPLLSSMKICWDNVEDSRLTQYLSSQKRSTFSSQCGANMRFSGMTRRVNVLTILTCLTPSSFVAGLTLTCPSSCVTFTRNIDTVTLHGQATSEFSRFSDLVPKLRRVDEAKCEVVLFGMKSKVPWCVQLLIAFSPKNQSLGSRK